MKPEETSDYSVIYTGVAGQINPPLEYTCIIHTIYYSLSREG